MPGNSAEKTQNDHWQLFDYVFKRDAGERGFHDSILSMYERNARWSNVIVRAFVIFLGFFLKPRAKSMKYIFWGTKYDELILSLPKSETCIVGGPKQLLFCLKNGRSFIPEMKLWQPLCKGLKIGEVTGEDNLLTLVILSLELKIRQYSSKDAVVIVDNDSLPAQRLVIQIARQAGIKQSICIQHGVFQRKSPGYILDGWFADRLFVMNQKQKKLLIEKGMSAEKISVMGFHSSPYIPIRPLSLPRERKICFLGQPWPKYGEPKGGKYLKIIDKVTREIMANGFELVFKPHPWEKQEDYLKHLPNIVNCTMKEAIENYDIFISLTSTALLEAKVSGRISIQLYDPLFESDCFDNMYGIKTLFILDKEFEKSLIESLEEEYSPEFDQQHAPLRDRFLKLIFDL